MEKRCIFVNFQQVLREVKVLANLSHSNVVGYHAAWLEYVTTDTVGVALPSKWSACACMHQLKIVTMYNMMYKLFIIWRSKIKRRILTVYWAIQNSCAIQLLYHKDGTLADLKKMVLKLSFIVVDVHQTSYMCGKISGMPFYWKKYFK